MNEAIDWTRLARYLAGTSTPEEQAEVEQWAAADAARAHLLSEMRRVWAAGKLPDFDANTAAALGRLHARMNARVKPHRPRYAKLAVAATLAAVAAGSLFVLTRDHTSTQIHATGIGTHETVTLPDGSVIALNVASQVRVELGDEERLVHLSGQASFDVSRDLRRPFRVVAGNAVIEVLGTRFDVKSYGADTHTTIEVEEGRVTVASDAGARVELSAGLAVDVAPGATALSPHEIAGGVSVWRQKQIRFADTTLDEAVNILERWYDVDVRILGNTLRKRRVTAVLDAGSLDDVLDALVLTLGASWRLQDGTIVIEAGP